MANYLVLTGGSAGIGEKTLSLFAQHGWKIINISRRQCQLKNVINFNIDLSDGAWPGRHAAALTAAVNAADKICLVHNAATFKTDNVTNLVDDDFRAVLETNLVAPVILNTLFIPLMQRGSAIIYIGSTLSEMAVPNRASYVITKHALIGLMRATCQDLAGKDITTCCICPGFVNTEMLLGNVDEKKLHAFIGQKVTAGRLIEPEEIADLVYYCASHPLTNGSVIHANLGQVMS